MRVQIFVQKLRCEARDHHHDDNDEKHALHQRIIPGGDRPAQVIAYAGVEEHALYQGRPPNSSPKLTARLVMSGSSAFLLRYVISMRRFGSPRTCA